MFADAWSAFLEFWAAQYGNVASVLGLFLTLLTLWKVMQVRKATQEVAAAAVARVALQLFKNDVTECLRLVRETRESCRAKQWPRALDRCEEARARLHDIQTSGMLLEEESTAVGSALSNLQLIEQYVESLLRPGAKRTELSGPKLRKLSDIIALVSRIAGRLRIHVPER